MVGVSEGDHLPSAPCPRAPLVPCLQLHRDGENQIAQRKTKAQDWCRGPVWMWWVSQTPVNPLCGVALWQNSIFWAQRFKSRVPAMVSPTLCVGCVTLLFLLGGLLHILSHHITHLRACPVLRICWGFGLAAFKNTVFPLKGTFIHRV